MFKTKNDLLKMAAPVQRVTGVLDNLGGRLARSRAGPANNGHRPAGTDQGGDVPLRRGMRLKVGKHPETQLER